MQVLHFASSRLSSGGGLVVAIKCFKNRAGGFKNQSTSSVTLRFLASSVQWYWTTSGHKKCVLEITGVGLVGLGCYRHIYGHKRSLIQREREREMEELVVESSCLFQKPEHYQQCHTSLHLVWRFWLVIHAVRFE